jgi:hypothetical protein
MPSKSLLSVLEAINAASKISTTPDETLMILQQIVMDVKGWNPTMEARQKAALLEPALKGMTQESAGFLAYILDHGDTPLGFSNIIRFEDRPKPERPKSFFKKLFCF